MGTDGRYTCVEPSICRDVESLGCTPENNVPLHVNNTQVKKLLKKKNTLSGFSNWYVMQVLTREKEEGEESLPPARTVRSPRGGNESGISTVQGRPLRLDQAEQEKG